MRGERRRRSSCEKHNQGSSVFTPEITILKSKVPEGGEEGELLDEQGDGGGRGGGGAVQPQRPTVRLVGRWRLRKRRGAARACRVVWVVWL